MMLTINRCVYGMQEHRLAYHGSRLMFLQQTFHVLRSSMTPCWYLVAITTNVLLSTYHLDLIFSQRRPLYCREQTFVKLSLYRHLSSPSALPMVTSFYGTSN